MSAVRPTNLGPATPLPRGASVAATYSGDDADWTTSGEGTNIALDYLIDVDVPSPVDQDVLTWDGYLGEWVAQAPTAGAAALADLTDVDLTGLADTDFLTYDSGSGTWVPTGAPSGTVPDGTAVGDQLVWDGSAWTSVGVTAWTAVTYQNSWVDYFASPASTLKYRKTADGLVILRGEVKSGTAGSTVATLPTGYRPGYRGYWAISATFSATHSGVYVNTNGTIIPDSSAGNAYVPINVVFYADA